nr:serine protease [uncultured Albidiferax sp.]
MSREKTITEEEVKLATCQVIGVSEAGTGWLISVDQILTAYHCLGEAAARGASVEVSFGASPSALKHRAVLEVLDVDLDVCLLRLSAPAEIEPVPLAATSLRPGTHWRAFGYPVVKLQIGQVLEGTVQQALSELANGIDLDLSVSAETVLSNYRGMSGAALMTANGCHGMLTSSPLVGHDARQDHLDAMAIRGRPRPRFRSTCPSLGRAKARPPKLRITNANTLACCAEPSHTASRAEVSSLHADAGVGPSPRLSACASYANMHISSNNRERLVNFPASRRLTCDWLTFNA